MLVLTAALMLVTFSTWAFLHRRDARAPRARDTGSTVRNSVQRAAHAATSRDMALARKELTSTLAAAPGDEPALLVLACIDLEENQLSEAGEVISRLRTLAPGRPEPKLLERLLSHRQQSPSSGWGQTFVDAWMELGRPDFQHSPLLPDLESASSDDPEMEEAAWQRAASVTDQLTLALSSPSLSEERAAWLLRQVPSIADPALLTAAFESLRLKMFPAILHREAILVLNQRLSRLIEGAPPSIQPRLMMLLAGTEEDSPLTPEELSALDEISVLPTWKVTSDTLTFQEARARLRATGVQAPGDRAFLLVERATGHGSALLLRRRAKVTRTNLSEDERRWLGRMLWRIGTRLAESSNSQERTVGFLLMDSGADDLENTCGQTEASVRQEELGASVIAVDKAAPERWPLPSLHEELEEARAHDERGWLLPWLGKSPLPR